MGNIGRAWARLASFFYKKTPIYSLTLAVKKAAHAKTRRHSESRRRPEIESSDSDEERDAQLDHMRNTKR